MINSLKKIFFLLKDRKKNLILIYISFVIISILDLIGLGLIGPFIGLMLNNETNFINNFFKVSEDKILVYLGIIIIFLFIIKILLSYF